MPLSAVLLIPINVKMNGNQATRIAQETLNGVGQPFLFLVHHVTHQHLERLHRHIDGSIEKHQRYQSEDHGRADCHTETSRIRQ